VGTTPTMGFPRTIRRWVHSMRKSNASGIALCEGGVSEAWRGVGSNGSSNSFPYPNLGSLIPGRLSLVALGNLQEEPSAGNPHARICEGESRMAELLDQPLENAPNCEIESTRSVSRLTFLGRRDSQWRRGGATTLKSRTSRHRLLTTS